MRNNLQKIVKEFLSWSRGDRNAIILLSILVVFAIVANQLIKRIEPKAVYTSEDFDRIIAEWDNTNKDKKEHINLSLFTFNPNIVSSEQLDSLNLPSIIKSNLLKYREAGGVFSKKEDFRKLYGINDSIYRSIEPFLIVEKPRRNAHNYQRVAKDITKKENGFPEMEGTNEVETKLESNPKSIVPSENILVEINSADTSALIALKGIGTVYAQRIIKYRLLLGGFYDKNQLFEVYGMDKERFIQFQNDIKVDSTSINKLRINFVGFKELLRHPYFSKEMVKSIMNEKELHGPIKNISELEKLKGFDSETIAKIRPYISFK